ncbi:Crp/Fnr family transcriptional regulator [Alteraurantiacibacter aquimixticola]|uniref:Crp/Fnr family transcriptional regulator n=1 Tax=Alteraurantiacibacter aquimixticola TaxID=2489173 RepID=A0A4T3EYV5_9SPHN|nr:Crp/Fnr family transcriptional regulator [Alteraurantiacibacter aquimixticola]TIX49711.1 Crp/Fnr family transcriptional regulator [Alteraurantiacibacter aquimixticola]
MLKDEWLGAISAVFGCNDDVAATLGREMSHVVVPHKTVIAHQGDLLEHCWLILDGAVRVQMIGWDGKRAQLAYHGPGELFGAYPQALTCRADIIANGKVETLRIPSPAMVAVAEAQAPISYGLSRLLARQLDMALDRMAARTTLSASGRLHAELLRLADDDNRIDPIPTVTALALSVNTSRETASRAITALERRGIVKREGQVMTIEAPRMLEDMVI